MFTSLLMSLVVVLSPAAHHHRPVTGPCYINGGTLVCVPAKTFHHGHYHPRPITSIYAR